MTEPAAERVKPGPKPLDVLATVEQINKYLDRAENDPRLDVSLLAVLRSKNVSVPRSTIDPYLKDPTFKPLFDKVRQRITDITNARRSVRQIVADAVAAARPARAKSQSPTEAPAPRDAVDEIRLARLHEAARAKAIYAMQRFVGRNRRAAHVSDLPVTARELNLALRQLQQVMSDLGPLVDAWNNRPESRAGDAAEPHPQGQLGLDDRDGGGAPA